MKTLLFTISIAAITCCNAQVSLVGTSTSGGFGNHGTLFSVTNAGVLDTLYNFNSGVNGCAPFGSMVLANDGNLYGFTASCGTNAVGTLIRYNPNTHEVNTVVDFSNSTGDGPLGNLIVGTDGNLYGMTNAGATDNLGTIFKCTTSGALTTLVTFTGANGANPCGTLQEGADGNFYGMTRFGGTNNEGIVFKCTPMGILTVLHSFSGTDGLEPLASVTIAQDSIMYGMTYGGGANSGGVIFRCSFSGNFKMLSSFSATTGIYPFGSLLNGKDGYLYGTTYYGGTRYDGTIFRCNDTGAITVLANFNDTNGANPEGSLTLASDGNMYGTTSSGGNLTTHSGAVFSYDRTSGKLTDIYQFSTGGPKEPQGDLMQINSSNTETGINQLAVNNSATLYPNPNNGEFTLEVNNTETASSNTTTRDNVKLEVYNTVGQIIHTENIQSDVQKSTINLGSEPSGVYIYKVISDNNGMLANGRFVINN
jgi:uncharacterized repeat protein (TIGR03803 family)